MQKKHFESTEILAEYASNKIIRILRKAIKENGQATFALAGGNSPKPIYHLLRKPENVAKVDWSKVHVFLSDERFVAEDHPESNLLAAKQSLLDYVPIPDKNIHAVATTNIQLEAAAKAYKQDIVQTLGKNTQFDLILLGMGPDGHTASLFPNHPAWLDNTQDLVIPVTNSPKPPSERISFNWPLIWQAQLVMLLVTGEDKVKAFEEATKKGSDLASLPVGNLKRCEGKLLVVTS